MKQFDNSTGLPKNSRVIFGNSIGISLGMNDLKKSCKEKSEEELSKLEKYLSVVAAYKNLDFGKIYFEKEHKIKIEKVLPILNIDSIISKNFEEGSVKKYQQKLEIYKRIVLEDLYYKFGTLSSVSNKKVVVEDSDSFVKIYKVSLETEVLKDNDFQFYKNEFTKHVYVDAYHVVDQEPQNQYLEEQITLDNHTSDF